VGAQRLSGLHASVLPFQMPLLDPSHPPTSILVVRLSSRGDVVFATSMIPALRRVYPDARITWVVEEESKGVVLGHPRLSRVVVMPRTAWRRALRSGRVLRAVQGFRAFMRELRAEEYDLVLDVQGILRSGLVARLSGAKRRIGLGSKEGSGALMHEVVESEGHGYDRVCSEYYHFAHELGLAPDDFAMDVALPHDTRRSACEHLDRAGLVRGRFVVLVPFTTRPQKHWFEDRWADLAGRIAHDLGLPVAILGGPDDRVAMDRIIAASNTELHDLVGTTSLGEAAAIVGQATAVVGVDTGLTHMAIAAQRPIVALFGSTLPYLKTPESVSRILHHPIHCSPCRKNPTCGGDWTCMRALDLAQVTQALHEVLVESGGTVSEAEA